MKKFFERLFKGTGIGIAMIIPGVSGGTLAVLLNIYNDIIDAINGLFRHFGKSMKVLIPILLGAVIGFGALVFPLKAGLSHCPLIIVSLFAGLIIGGIPELYKVVRGKESFTGFLIAFIAIAFMVGICFCTKILEGVFDLTSMSVGLWFYLFAAGIIVAATLVIPGISGSMMLMCMGLYYSVLNVISELMTLSNIVHDLCVLLPLVLGAVIGFFLISFIMGKLLKKHETGTYFAILGFIVGSLGTIYYLTISSDKYPVTWNALQISLSIVALIAGAVLTFFLERWMSKKKAEEISEKDESNENEA